jgi:hypothetical protein
MNARTIGVWLVFAAIAAGMPLAATAQQPKPPVKTPSNDPGKWDEPAKEPSKKADRQPEREPTPAPDKGKIDLRPKFRQGEEIRLKLEMDNTCKVEMQAVDERPRESVLRQEIGLALKVTEVTEEGTQIEASISGVKMKQTSGSGPDKETIEFDSSQPEAKDKDNPLAPSLRALAKTVFTFTVDKDGNIGHVGGGGNLTSLGAMGLNDGLGAGLPGVSGGGLSGQAFQDAIGSIVQVKKGGGLVNVGDKWENVDQMDSGLLGRFRMVTRHAVKSYRGGNATVSILGTIEPDTRARGGTSGSLFQVKDSFLNGNYIWDTERGMIRSMEMDQRVKIETNAAGSAVTMEAESKARVKRMY